MGGVWGGGGGGINKIISGTLEVDNPTGPTVEIENDNIPPFSNWCVISLTNTPSLNADTQFYSYQAADLTIVRQAGTDFSIGNDPISGSGAILSEQGGWFGSGFSTSNPNAGQVTLDESSSEQRYIQINYVVGINDDTNPLTGLGMDMSVPVSTDSNADGSLLQTLTAIPGLTPPGGPALAQIQIALIPLVGTDTVAYDGGNGGWFQIVVWQLTQI